MSIISFGIIRADDNTGMQFWVRNTECISHYQPEIDQLSHAIMEKRKHEKIKKLYVFIRIMKHV